MADEFLRVGGRGTDGTAKAIKTDNYGNVGVQVYGIGVSQINISDSTSVLSAGYQDIEIKELSKICHLKNLFITIGRPTSSTSGTHTLEFRLGTLKTLVASMTASYNETISIANSSTSNSIIPLDTRDFWEVLRNISFTSEQPLYLRYKNDTNVTQTYAKVIRIYALTQGV